VLDSPSNEANSPPSLDAVEAVRLWEGSAKEKKREGRGS
jgi:hypothetical protein